MNTDKVTIRLEQLIEDIGTDMFPTPYAYPQATLIATNDTYKVNTIPLYAKELFNREFNTVSEFRRAFYKLSKDKLS